MVETSLRILDLLQFTTQININCMKYSGTAWAALGTKSPIFPGQRGHRAPHRDRPVSAPCLDKESEQGEERKLLPESEPQARRAHHNLRITADWKSHSLCHDVRGTPEGEGRGDIDRSPQINEPSTITSPPSTLALSSVFSLPTLCFLSLALSHTPAPPAFDRGRCERAKDRQRLYCEVITQKTRSRQLGVGHTG